MDEKRLQEIKDKHTLKDGVEWTNQEDLDTENVIKELIAALEIQYVISEEMDKGRAFYRELVHEYEQDTFPELKKQLAEAQDNEVQSAKAYEKLITKNGKLQEAVEYWKYEMAELRPDEL